MSNNVYFQHRRFVDIDSQGNEVEDPNNYGYVIFNDDAEILSTGMNNAELIDLLKYDASQVVNVIKDLGDDNARFSFLHSIEREKGLYIGDTWHEVLNKISSVE